MRTSHRKLITRIEEEMRLTASATGRRRLSAPVRRAMERVEREAFVRPADRKDAYRDRPLSIGHGQTVSQPFVVALMTELLDPLPGDRVLEVGTGCGYATAVLAEIVAHVHTVEVVPELARSAAERLAALGYTDVEVHEADGHAGWPAGAPYDAILVTAAAREIPDPLLVQLRPGGRMVIPVGAPGGVQDLVVVTKAEDGAIGTRFVLPVAFVPLVSSS